MDDMHGHMTAMSKDMGKLLQSMELMHKHMAMTPPSPTKR